MNMFYRIAQVKLGGVISLCSLCLFVRGSEDLRFRSLITIRRLSTNYHLDLFRDTRNCFYTHDILCVFFVIHTECNRSLKSCILNAGKKKKKENEEEK